MQEQAQTTNVEATEATPQVELDPVKVQEFRARLERQQSLPAGVVAGLVAAVAGAVVWAVVTVASHYQIGYMAVGVGFLVGLAVRHFGRGVTAPFAAAGCLLALLGCLLGNLLSACGFLSVQESIPLAEILSRLNPDLAMRLLTVTFSPMDLLFYGIALYAGYNYSVRRITPEELQLLVKEKS
jgi:hypothetical protein